MAGSNEMYNTWTSNSPSFGSGAGSSTKVQALRLSIPPGRCKQKFVIDKPPLCLLSRVYWRSDRVSLARQQPPRNLAPYRDCIHRIVTCVLAQARKVSPQFLALVTGAQHRPRRELDPGDGIARVHGADVRRISSATGR